MNSKLPALAGLAFLVALFGAALANFRERLDSSLDATRRLEDRHSKAVETLAAVERRERSLALEVRAHALLPDRIRTLEREIARGESVARLGLDEIGSVRRALARDPDALAHEVLHPSVQVNGKGGVGGGTILFSDAKNGTFVVTAFHVVQKVVTKKDGLETREPVEIRTYTASGELDETLEADVVAYHEKRDIALLRLKTTRIYKNVARLARRETLRAVTVFTPIYAVGCPLGHDPLPSLGEISTLHKEVNGEKFWMMNAPTIFGNSGGGIFHRETREMIGVSAMICTFDNFVSTPVPHLGILVSLTTLYDWLDEQFYQFLYDASFTPERCAQLKLEAQKTRATARIKVEY